jgi:signal transduction histidine kinase
VSLRCVGGEISFTVADDGEGFDPRTAKRGVGLRSMTERLEALGGAIEVRSAPGGGTTVAGRIPRGSLGRGI